jgi:hypothetical protein
MQPTIEDLCQIMSIGTLTLIIENLERYDQELASERRAGLVLVARERVANMINVANQVLKDKTDR